MRRPLAVLVALCLTAAVACGDPDAETGASGTTTSSTPPAPETTAPAPTTTTTTAERELTDRSRLRLDGIGPVTIGMTPEEATRVVGREVAVDERSLLHDAESVCGFAEVSGGPAGLGFMVLRADPGSEWRIYRIDVFEEGRIATGGGIRIGSTEDQVKLVYGEELKVEPHHYTGPEGHYLVLDVDGEGTGFMLLFETDGAKVTQFRSGNDEAVRYVEGCA